MKWILPRSILSFALVLISTHALAIRVAIPKLVLALDTPTVSAAVPATIPTDDSTAAAPAITLYSLDSAVKLKSGVSGNFYIQLGCFKNKANAEQLVKDIKFRTDDPVTMVEQNGYFIVTMGPYHSSEDVKGISEILALFMPKMKHLSDADAKCPTAAKTASESAPATKTETETKTTPSATTETKTETTTAKTVPHHKHAKKPIYHARAREYKGTSYIHIKLLNAHGNWYIAGDLGVWAPLVDNTMTVNNGSGLAAPFNLDTYTTNTRWGGEVGLGTGYRWQRDSRWLPAYSIGLRYKHLFATNIGQQVLQFSAPDFTNYNYTWNVASDVLLLASKINLFQIGQFLPFINGGVGISFNRITNYSETPLPDVTPRTSPSFANNSMHGFAYSIGAGVDWQVHPQLIMSIDYEFQGLGSIDSRSGANAWSSVHLHSGTYQSNNVLLSINYLIER